MLKKEKKFSKATQENTGDAVKNSIRYNPVWGIPRDKPR